MRDEAARLPRFLNAALLWADAAVILDQCSSDGSAEVARSYERISVIDNPDPIYDEGSRQKHLIDAARSLFPGPRFLVALDADELLSADVLTSSSWRAATRAQPGTCVQLGRAELGADPSHYLYEWWADHGKRGLFAYADDTAPHHGVPLHSTRLPAPPGSLHVALKDVVVLHFARCNLARARSKERWYQCYEHLNCPEFNDVEIRRRYDYYERKDAKLKPRPCPRRWLDGYLQAGIDIGEPQGDGLFWDDWEVLRMFATYGVERFARLDIWSVDWEAIRQEGLIRRITGLPAVPVSPPTGLLGGRALG